MSNVDNLYTAGGVSPCGELMFYGIAKVTRYPRLELKQATSELATGRSIG